MAKPMIDPDALISMFEGATARQGEQLRQAVGEATLKALQARELTLKNIRSTLAAVTDAAGQGAAKNLVAGADVPALLDKAVAGMDDALLRAVEANRTALSTLMAQGADLKDKQLGRALQELEKIEDSLIGAVRKMAQGATPMAAPWAQVLEKMQVGGTQSGASAATAVEQLMEQTTQNIRAARGASLRAAQAMAESYAALASGVLIGMSEAMQRAATASKAAAPAPAARSKK